MDPKTFKLLQQADWGAIGKELLAYAERRARNYWWRHGVDLELAQGKTVEDVVQEVIVKTLAGERRWDPDKGLLVPWLRAQVNSIVDALARSAPHRYEWRIPEGENDLGIIDNIEYLSSEVNTLAIAQSSSPEETLLEKETAEEVEKKISALFEAVGGEPDLEEILVAIMDGCEPKPRYLAEWLGVSVQDIYNRRKRLCRHALSLKGKVL